MSSQAVDQSVQAEHVLSVGVSIVLYRTRAIQIRSLVDHLFEQGVARVYLVDNSPPAFGAFDGWAANDRVTTIQTGRNLGYGRAHNPAIRDSVRHHAYHLICNPDISLGDNAIPELYRVLQERPEVGLCMPKVLGVDGSVQYLCKRPPAPIDFAIRSMLPAAWLERRRTWFEMRDESYEHERAVECLSGCFMFFRSSVLQQIGGFDERFFLYLEDFDISRRAAAVATNLYYPGVQVVHVHERGHSKSVRLFLAVLASAIRYFNKWGWFEQSWSLDPVGGAASARRSTDVEDGSPKSRD
jgi:GT2 family glycosyltransferase